MTLWMKKNVLNLVNIEGQCICIHLKKSLTYIDYDRQLENQECPVP